MKWTTCFLVSSMVAVAGVAAAEVRHEGEWPADEQKVSLDLERAPRSKALKTLAERAGWSLVSEGVGDEPVDVRVSDQPPGKVLDLVLGDGDWTARRDGALVSVKPEHGKTAAAPKKGERGEDRNVTGGNLRIEKGEVVHDVSVVGGNLDVLGQVTGDIMVMGGNVYVHDGAHVEGDITSAGGNIDVRDGAIVDGDVGVVGGVLHRGPRSKIGGAIEVGESDPPHHGFLQRIGEALTQSALLFVFGAVMLTLMGRRMETLQAEVAARPMRSFALGVLGVLGFALTLVALVVTVVGIPVALLLAIGGVLAMYASICATLATLGRALLKHKTDSPYVHLALGCAIFLVSSHLPFIGGPVTLVVGLIGIGTLVATRLGGLWPAKRLPQQGPYRAPV